MINMKQKDRNYCKVINLLVVCSAKSKRIEAAIPYFSNRFNFFGSIYGEKPTTTEFNKRYMHYIVSIEFRFRKLYSTNEKKNKKNKIKNINNIVIQINNDLQRC